MKRIFHHPPAKSTGCRYWRSVEEYADTPEFRQWLQREFPDGAAEFEADGVARRNFLRLMGASLALAGVGLSGCRRPQTYLVPYTKSVEWLIPGRAVLYSTSIPGRLGGTPLIATTYEGRPTKIEGNPNHPASLGATTVWAQADVLDLYDPDRAQTITTAGSIKTKDDFWNALNVALQSPKSNHGATFRILTESISSPTLLAQLDDLMSKFPAARW